MLTNILKIFSKHDTCPNSLRGRDGEDGNAEWCADDRNDNDHNDDINISPIQCSSQLLRTSFATLFDQQISRSRATKTRAKYQQSHWNKFRQASRRHASLASMSLCKYRSSAHLLKLTRTTLKLTGKLVCDVARIDNDNTWWRHQWRHKTRIDYPWGPYRYTI